MNKGFESAQPRQQMCGPLCICTLLSLHWAANLSTEIAYLDLNVFVALKTGAQAPATLKAFQIMCFSFPCLLSV